MITLTHEVLTEDTFYTGTDIINPHHIVNMMFNDIEAPRITIEFVNRTTDIEFKTYKQRDIVAEAIATGLTATFTIVSLRNIPSRWS